METTTNQQSHASVSGLLAQSFRFVPLNNSPDVNKKATQQIRLQTLCRALSRPATLLMSVKNA
jgi:hypothetical protein